jgi:hypothetical protein
MQKEVKMIIFLLGIFIGGFIGIIMMSLFSIGKEKTYYKMTSKEIIS